MRSLENTLKILEMNAEDFDIEVFLEDLMSIPFQIKKIDENIHALGDKDIDRYFSALDILKQEALNAKPRTRLQEDVLRDIVFAIDEELHKQVA